MKNQDTNIINVVFSKFDKIACVLAFLIAGLVYILSLSITNEFILFVGETSSNVVAMFGQSVEVNDAAGRFAVIIQQTMNIFVYVLLALNVVNFAMAIKNKTSKRASVFGLFGTLVFIVEPQLVIIAAPLLLMFSGVSYMDTKEK